MCGGVVVIPSTFSSSIQIPVLPRPSSSLLLKSNNNLNTTHSIYTFVSLAEAAANNKMLRISGLVMVALVGAALAGY